MKTKQEYHGFFRAVFPVIVLVLLAAVLPAHAGREEAIRIEPGTTAADSALGYGWSQPELLGVNSTAARWMTHLEGDVYFEVPESGTMNLELTVSPFYLAWIRQSMGIYMNNQFIGERVFQDSSEFERFSLDIPPAVVRKGRNRLTLRAGYRHRSFNAWDPRTLSLAVTQIILTPQ